MKAGYILELLILLLVITRFRTRSPLSCLFRLGPVSWH